MKKRAFLAISATLSVLLIFSIFLLLPIVSYAVPDADQDGVPDCDGTNTNACDNCPDSTTTVVDQFGCSCEQKNCASDNNPCTDDCIVAETDRGNTPICRFRNNTNTCPGGHCSGGECKPTEQDDEDWGGEDEDETEDELKCNAMCNSVNSKIKSHKPQKAGYILSDISGPCLVYSGDMATYHYSFTVNSDKVALKDSRIKFKLECKWAKIGDRIEPNCLNFIKDVKIVGPEGEIRETATLQAGGGISWDIPIEGYQPGTYEGTISFAVDGDIQPGQFLELGTDIKWKHSTSLFARPLTASSAILIMPTSSESDLIEVGSNQLVINPPVQAQPSQTPAKAQAAQAPTQAQPTQTPAQPFGKKDRNRQKPGQKDRNLYYANTVTGDWIKQWYEPIWNAILAKPEHQRVFNNYIQTASYIYLKNPARVFVLKPQGGGRYDTYAFQNIPINIEKTTIPGFALMDVTFTVEIPEGVKVLKAKTGSLNPRVPPQPGDIEGIIDGNTVTWNIPNLAMTTGAEGCRPLEGCYIFHIETDGGVELTESQVATLKWHVSGIGGTQDTEWAQIIGVQPATGTSAPYLPPPK